MTGMSPDEHVGTVLRSLAGGIEPDPPDIERILSAGRRRRRIRIAASVVSVAAVTTIGVTFGAHILPNRNAGTPRAAISVDPGILRAVNNLGAQEADARPYRLRYVATTSARAAPLFEGSAGPSASGVIVATAEGHYTQTFVPKPPAHDHFTTLLVLLNRRTLAVLAFGTRGAPLPDATMLRLGPVTDCTLRYSSTGYTNTCHN
ncbi:MAG: hypothetical protein ACR2FF_01735 [Mycobacteriales bacterium]